MNKLGRFLLKLGAVLTALAAVGTILYKWKEKEDQKKEALDAYLMGDHDEQPVETFYVRSNLNDLLSEDVEDWNSLDENARVNVTFTVSPENARKFQENIAKTGSSTTYDDTNQVMEVHVCGPMDHEELTALANTLKDAAARDQAHYQGFTFE